jgi:SAM-dependent methyltransferase
MSQTVLAESPPGRASIGLDLVLTDCPLCGEDEGEPVAVGQDFACSVAQDSFLVLACSACGLLYLNPRPAAGERRRLYPDEYFLPGGRAWQADQRPCRRAVMALLRGLTIKPDARVLEVGYGRALHVDLVRQAGPPSCLVDVVTPHPSLARAAQDAGCQVYESLAEALQLGSARYDFIFLIYALEHCGTPVEEMASLRRLLQPGGRLLTITPNAESWAWRPFQGRHWAGYDFPRHSCLYSARTLPKLAATTGFAVERFSTSNHPGLWARSAENFLTDWGAPAWVTRTVARGLALLSPVTALAGHVRRAQAAGTQLEAVMRKPVESQV